MSNFSVEISGLAYRFFLGVVATLCGTSKHFKSKANMCGTSHMSNFSIEISRLAFRFLSGCCCNVEYPNGKIYEQGKHGWSFTYEQTHVYKPVF